ncbi:MAG: hypothetical protein HY654_06600 [Acidobacteria bacterium]|nr:hypothetical protein [Acidobacteriota bacterium]
MKPLSSAIALTLIVAAAAPLWAHGNYEHVRGVVTVINSTSMSVELQDKKTRTLTITAKSTFEKSGEPAQIKDLKVGERVVIEVPKGTAEARIVRFGPPKKGK